MTEPFRMAAMLIYAQALEAEFYAEMRHKEAEQNGMKDLAVWWADVHKAITSLRAIDNVQNTCNHVLN